MGELSPWHWLIVALVIVVLFGSKRLPDAARSIGRSMRIFKAEVGRLDADDEIAPPAVSAPPPTEPEVPPEPGTPPGPPQPS